MKDRLCNSLNVEAALMLTLADRKDIFFGDRYSVVLREDLIRWADRMRQAQDEITRLKEGLK